MITIDGRGVFLCLHEPVGQMFNDHQNAYGMSEGRHIRTRSFDAQIEIGAKNMGIPEEGDERLALARLTREAMP